MQERRARKRSETTAARGEVHGFADLARRSLSLTLVLDADFAAAKTLCAQLTAAGFPTLAASSRDEASEAFRHSFVEVVVVTLDPALAGDLAFLDQLRRMSLRTWIVVASARGGEPARRTVFQHGGDALVSPLPCTLERLAVPLAGFTARSRPCCEW
jgi:DNA-binding response OmpR family regulator